MLPTSHAFPTNEYALPGSVGQPAAVVSRSVLIVGDERAVLTAHFVREGWRVTGASGMREAGYRLAQGEFDLLLSDVRLSDGSGLELLRVARHEVEAMPVVLMTGHGTVTDAVEAMREGAGDYLAKPVSWPMLRIVAERLVGRESERGLVTAVPQTNRTVAGAAKASASMVMPATERAGAERLAGRGMVGRAPALREALARAQAAASTGADVLVEAESGTGKELLARFIHEASDRAGRPFIAVNCAAVPEHLLESELFGHTKGAFTGATQARPGKFELAHGGTLLLDEIGEMPLHLQPKLLRALQEREFERLGDARTVKVDIRVIATTNVALTVAVDRGAFRSDLYYRLNVIPLSLPSLRERVEDIRPLAQHFAESWAARIGRSTPLLGEDFLDLLERQSWPGNVRELGNFICRVLSLHSVPVVGQVIGAGCFEREFYMDAQRKLPSARPPIASPVLEIRGAGEVPAGAPIRQLERMHLEKTLAMTHGNRTHAAEMLGISLRTMRNKIREYGLPPRRYA